MNQTLNAHRLKEGFEEFRQERQPGDIDLIKFIRDMLIENGMEAHLPAYDSEPILVSVANKPSHIQRWTLNRYWTLQLCMLQESTSAVRIYLIQDGSSEDWARLFSQHVLPFAKDRGLPIRLNGGTVTLG